MTEPSKAVRRRLRELVGLAYERELNQHLDLLFQDFESWKRDELSPFDLREKIQQFHQKPARELYVLYTDRNLEDTLARAVFKGLLSKEEVGEPILGLLERFISLYREALEDR